MRSISETKFLKKNKKIINFFSGGTPKKRQIFELLLDDQGRNFIYIPSYVKSGMRLGFGKNSGKFYVAIDSNPIQHRRF